MTERSPGHLRVRYAAFDRVPPSLRSRLLSCRHGLLRDRVRGVLQLREALIDGVIPAAKVLAWPEPALRALLLESLARADAGPACAGEPDVTDHLLHAFMDVVEGGERDLEVVLREIEFVEDPASCRPGDKAWGIDLYAVRRSRRMEALLTDERWAQARADAVVLAREQIAERAGVVFQHTVRERVRIAKSLRDLLAKLAEDRRVGWGLGSGLLRACSWLDLLDLERALRRASKLDALTKLLGRSEDTDDAGAPLTREHLGGPRERVRETARRTAGGSVERTGVTRGGDLQRMLPIEASYLAHPTLRLLWHARRIERSLLQYDAMDEAPVRAPSPVGADEGPTVLLPRAERGPILAIIDTSGSMVGVPEELAKAVVLRVVSVAHGTGRDCYLYNFSGPSDVLEQPVSRGPSGYADLLAFLGNSFHGGTEPTGALRRTVRKLEEPAWRRADVVFVSDGLFSVPDEVAHEVRAVKAKHDVRFHAVLVSAGDGSDAHYASNAAMAMRSFCDPVHLITGLAALDAPP